VHECVELTGCEYVTQVGFGHRSEGRANFRVGAGYQGAVAVGDGQKFAQVALGLRTPADLQEIDDLDEQSGVATARPPYRLDQFGEAGNESVVAYPEQRAASNIPDSCRLDDHGARPASGEALIPGQHLGGDVALFGGAPRLHGGHPGTLLQRDSPDAHRAEPARAGSL